jgi:hypothetical protein
MSGLPPPKICQRILAPWVVFGEPDWTENDRLRLLNLLSQHGQSVSDLPRIFHATGVTAAPSRPKGDRLYERIWRFFCHLNVDDKPIREGARKKLDELLKKQNLDWNGANGFTAILVVYWADNNNISAGTAAAQTTTDDELKFSALDFFLALLEDYHVMWSIASSPRCGGFTPMFTANLNLRPSSYRSVRSVGSAKRNSYKC